MKTKIAYLGLLTTFALCLSYLESLIPAIVPIPGIKLGLANFAVLLTLYLYGFKEAFFVNFARIILASILFGSIYSFIYALAGGILSLIGEYIFIKLNIFSEIGISIIGAILHNLGQIIIAYFILKNVGIFYYFMFLILAAVITGTLNGYLVKILIPRIKKIIK